MNDAQIKHMVNRFLGWKLPENFNPDGGVSFKKTFNEHTAHPMKHEPSGTNLLDASQVEAMIRYLVEGLPPSQHLRAIADAAQAYVESVHGEPEKDCWATEDGKEAPGAEPFASDWAWREYDAKKQKAFDALRAALATTEGKEG